MIINGKKSVVPSKDLKAGDLVIVNSHQRVPADLLILAATLIFLY